LANFEKIDFLEKIISSNVRRVDGFLDKLFRFREILWDFGSVHVEFPHKKTYREEL
jgi:hypothetical protein